MTNETFQHLSANENIDWYCLKCTIPQFSDSFFDHSSTHSQAGLDAGGSSEKEEIYNWELNQMKCQRRKSLIFSHVNIQF